MKVLLALVVLGLAATAYATEQEDFNDIVAEDQARFLYFNTSSTATSLTLLGALILLGVIAYLVYAGGLLGSSGGYNRNSYAEQEYYDPNAQYQQYRSNDAESTFNGLNIIKWISMLNEVYEKFDMNDLDCQKKLICEITSEPEYYGSAARSFKTGLQYARYLEVLNLPDELRELLDEYMDAEQTQECEFKCPYSIKDSFANNSL
jgi:hypothetical protein